MIGQAAHAQLLVSSLNSHEVLGYQPGSGELMGEGIFVSAAGAGLDRPHGILDRSTGVLVASFGSNEVKRYDRATGQFIDNFIPNTAGLSLPVYLAIGPDDGLLYVSSQGNDRILRFDLETGAAVDARAFIEGGLLDAPSGFDWSPDGAVLYVAGRASGNVLAYDASTGAPRTSGHSVATGLSGNNDTFGLKVDAATGDLFVASGGDVLRFDAGGNLLATIPITGLPIGLENGPDGGTLWVAANNTLHPVNKSGNAVGPAFLIGGTINILNFFHFSTVTDDAIGRLGITPVEAGTVRISTTISKVDPPGEIALQWSPDLLGWDDAVVFQWNNGRFDRMDLEQTTGVALEERFSSVVVTEQDPSVSAGHPRRFYRLWQRP